MFTPVHIYITLTLTHHIQLNHNMKVTGKQELPKCVSLSTGKVFKKVAFKRLRFCPIHIDYVWQKKFDFQGQFCFDFQGGPHFEEHQREDASQGG